ncbi:MAG: DUF58 domain-containing protein [Aquimonas sp.]|nr:DUF58 domain-containing protein [Aquimonas sp.]
MSIGVCEPSLSELLALRARAQALAAGARRRSADRAAGSRHSPFRGRGMDYAESRAYASGDDVRHVDWRLTARAGKLHTKLFAAERERTSAVLLDTSISLRFGTRQGFKSVQAARLAALFLWFAQSEGDRVTAAAFGAVSGQLPAQGTHRGVLRALSEVEHWSRVSPQGGPALPLSAAADRMGRVLQGGGHILLLLDCASLDAEALRALARLRRDHDLAALVLADPLEREPLPPGRYRIETPRGLAELHSDGRLAPWQTALRERQQQAVDALRRIGAGVRIASTREDPVRSLQDLLRGRPQEAA